LEKEFCPRYYYTNTYTEEQIVWHYNSWTKQHNLICNDASLGSGYKQLTMLVTSFAPLIFCIISDIIGRIKTIRITAVLIFVFTLGGYFIEDMAFKSISMGF